MWDDDAMDTANLEAAARRYRDTEAALDTARTNLQAEAVAFLQQHDERGSQAAAARITGWSREHIRNLWKKAEEEAERSRREAEVEALRRKVEELSAPAEPPVPPRGPSRSPEPQRQAPARKPAPEPKEGRPLTDEEAKTLAEIVRSRATPTQLRGLEQDVEGVPDGLKDFTYVSAGMNMGLLTHDEVYGPVSSEETTT
jgi:hypothetical protein